MSIDFKKFDKYKLDKPRSKTAKLKLLGRLTGGIKGCKTKIRKYGDTSLGKEYYGYYKRLGGKMTFKQILKTKR